MRVTIIGNAGGGKSTLAARLARTHALPCHEVDRILWEPGWTPVPRERYEADHAAILRSPAWIVEGVGHRESIEPRVRASTHVVLIDLPLWQHYWLIAERHAAWTRGERSDTSAVVGEPPPLKAVCEMVATLDRDWMPEIRQTIDDARDAGACVQVVRDVGELEPFELQRPDSTSSILTPWAMKDLYGEFRPAGRTVRLDARQIPSNLLPLVEYAEFWGVSDDWEREELVLRASDGMRSNLRAVVREHDDALGAWLAGPEASSTSPSDAYIAFSAMRMAADFA